MNTPTWHVMYTYDGGRGGEFIQTVDAETAGREVMSRATPTYNPGSKCKLAAVHRILFYEELAALPHRGLETAVDLTWDRRDKGEPYLIVERGSRREPETGRDYWMTTGRIVRSVASAEAGAKIVTDLTRKHHGYSGIYDLVPRKAVKLTTSSAPYGCYAGERSA